jgi:hypothetical protein
MKHTKVHTEEDESSRNKNKVELNPDQIYIKHLTIDDCGMKDAEFAAILNSLVN